MVVLGVILMIGALLWFVIVTRKSASRAAALATPVVSAVTPVASFVTPFASSVTPVASSVAPVASPAIPYPEIKRVSQADARAAFELKSAVFVDVRGEPYYSEAHIPGALSMTYDELSSRMGELDKKGWIITYCA
jgi:hypothetical protein